MTIGVGDLGQAPVGRPGVAIAAIIVSATLIGTTLGFSFPLLSLVLERHGYGTGAIGLNSAVSAAAVFVIAPWLPRLVSRLGAVRSMVIGQLIGIGCLLILPLKVDLAFWFAVRFVLGFGTVLAWVAAESVVNALAEERLRGRVMGIYGTLFCIGYAGGPLVLGLVGSHGLRPFLVGALVFAAGLLPLLAARGASGALATPGDTTLRSIWRYAPLAFGAVLVVGLIDTACFALLPIYGLRIGFGEAGAVWLLSALVAGNILLQLPIGWLADHWPRALVLIGCAAAALVATVVWPLIVHTALIWPVVVVFGGLLGGLYTVSLALLGERFKGSDLAVANTAFVMMFQLGAMAGPALGGAAIEMIGPVGLPVLMAVTLLGFVGFAGVRQVRVTARA